MDDNNKRSWSKKKTGLILFGVFISGIVLGGIAMTQIGYGYDINYLCDALFTQVQTGKIISNYSLPTTSDESIQWANETFNNLDCTTVVAHQWESRLNHS